MSEGDLLPVNNNESSDKREDGLATLVTSRTVQTAVVTSRHVQASLRTKRQSLMDYLSYDQYDANREVITRLMRLVLLFLLIGACVAHYVITRKSETFSYKPVPLPLPQHSIQVLPEKTGHSHVVQCPLGSRTVSCNVNPEGSPDDIGGYLFTRSALVPPYPKRNGKIWGFMFNESPYSAPEIMYDKFWRLFNVTSTFNRHSDVPMTLLDLPHPDNFTSTEFFVPTVQKNYYLSKLAPVMYLQSNCNTWTKRDEYVKELMKYIRVDSYGLCLNSKRLPGNLNYGDTEWYHTYDPQLMQLVARYKFTLAIENAVCHDYVTEKLWRPLIAGSVPLYLGSPDVRDLLPHARAALLLSGFPTPELLARRLHRLLRNDSLYDLHLHHKTHRVITNPLLLDIWRDQYHTVDGDRWREKESKVLCLMCSLLHEPGPPRQASRRHCDCHLPLRALTMEADPTSYWLDNIDKSELNIKLLYNESTALEIMELGGARFI